MIAVALRSFFFVGIILCYSSGVWNLINGYFGKEFKTYLKQYGGAKIHDRPSDGKIADLVAKLSIPPEKQVVTASLGPAPSSTIADRSQHGIMDTKDSVSVQQLSSSSLDDIIEHDVRALNSELLSQPLVDERPVQGSNNPIDETWLNNYWKTNPRKTGSSGEYSNEANTCSALKIPINEMPCEKG